MEVTKPYKFRGFGAMEVTKPYKFIGFGAMDVTKPYKFIGFGTYVMVRRDGRCVFTVLFLLFLSLGPGRGDEVAL